MLTPCRQRCMPTSSASVRSALHPMPDPGSCCRRVVGLSTNSQHPLRFPCAWWPAMTPWLQILLSLGAGLVTASGALLGVRLTIRSSDRATSQRDFASQRETQQRELAARREEWWRRFTWAAELTWDETKAKRVIGLRLLTQLVASELTGEEECLLLDAISQRVLGEFEVDEDTDEER